MERGESSVLNLADSSAWVLGGVGAAVGLLLLLALRFLLPTSRRGDLRFPLTCVVLNLVLSIIHAVVDGGVSGGLRLVALILILLSLGRLGFLFFVEVLFNTRSQRPLPRILTDILQFVVYAAGAVIALRSSGVEPSSLLTTSALLTAVIGLALQETLGNLVAGLAIQAQRPFEVGDWVQVGSDQKQIGQVVEINWRATKLSTEDRVEVIVPNGPLAKGSIFNFSKPTTLIRRTVVAYAPLTVPPGMVQKAILSSIKQVPDVLSDPAPEVLTTAFRDREGTMEYTLRYFTMAFERREQTDAQVRDRIWYALDRAELAGPPVVLAEQELSQVERYLRGIDFIKTLKEDELRALAGRIRKRRFAAGEAVIREGDAGDELFIIRRGSVRVLVRQQEVAKLGQGSFFGEMSLLTGEKRSATVEAAEDSELYVVGHAAFDDVLRANPSVAEEMSRTLALRQLALDKLKEQSASQEVAIAQRSNQLLERIKSFFSLG